jgi:hypothetical protein
LLHKQGNRKEPPSQRTSPPSPWSKRLLTKSCGQRKDLANRKPGIVLLSVFDLFLRVTLT